MSNAMKVQYDFIAAKEDYRAFCEEPGHDIRVFAQPWYLDAVCESPEDWRVILIKENERVVAAFPFGYHRGKFGMRMIANPWQAARLGIWMDYGEKKRPGAREDFENKVIAQIIERLPPYDMFLMHFDERLQNWQEFYRRGFSQTLRYSYILSCDGDAFQSILPNMHRKKRRQIAEAERAYLLDTNIDKEEYWAFFEASYQKRGRVPQYGRAAFFRLHEAAMQHGAMQAYAARGESQKIVGTLYALKDGSRWYNMFGTFDTTAKPGAQAWLSYRAAADALAERKTFDFEGSMIPGVAQFNSEFGAMKEPYFQITNYSDRMKFLMNCKECLDIIKRSAARVLRKKKNDQQ